MPINEAKKGGQHLPLLLGCRGMNFGEHDLG